MGAIPTVLSVRNSDTLLYYSGRGGEGVYSLWCMTVVVWPYTLASLHCRGGARRVLADQADSTCTKSKTPWGVGWVVWSCIVPRTSFQADFLAYWGQRQWIDIFSDVATSRDNKWVYYATASWVSYPIHTHCVIRSSKLCGTNVFPALIWFNSTVSRGNRKRKMIRWLSRSRSERRVSQRRRQPTPQSLQIPFQSI